MKVNEDTIKNLRLFRMQVTKLKANPDFFKNLNYEFKGKQEKWGMSFQTSMNGPDEKTVKSFLMDVRPFILRSESINFNKICNAISKDIKDEDLTTKINNAKIAWDK